MIKEKPIKSKYRIEKTKVQIIKEYFRTIVISLFIAFVITSSITLHARNEMTKNLFEPSSNKNSLDKQLAIQMIGNDDLTKDIQNKTYSVCMHVGDLYETIEDYQKAQFAYEQAILKAKNNNYKPYYKLITVLAIQSKFDEAREILDSIEDNYDKNLIKFKTRSYIIIGDKYYSTGKALSATKSYEKALFYYNKFSKKDKKIEEALNSRIVNSYVKVADIMVQSGLNSDAIRYLDKAEKYDSNNFNVKYKKAIVLSDLDPEKSIPYFEKLLKETPQYIDYGAFGVALMKAANIADLDNRSTQAKYYRYKIYSVDLFVNRKVIYKNDIDVTLKTCDIKKTFFTYPIKLTFLFENISNNDIVNLHGDFILLENDKEVEKITRNISDKNNPLVSYYDEPNLVYINFSKKIFTKKELENYKVLIYLYKDEKYKTAVAEFKLPIKK